MVAVCKNDYYSLLLFDPKEHDQDGGSIIKVYFHHCRYPGNPSSSSVIPRSSQLHPSLGPNYSWDDSTFGTEQLIHEEVDNIRKLLISSAMHHWNALYDNSCTSLDFAINRICFFPVHSGVTSSGCYNGCIFTEKVAPY